MNVPAIITRKWLMGLSGVVVVGASTAAATLPGGHHHNGAEVRVLGEKIQSAPLSPSSGTALQAAGNVSSNGGGNGNGNGQTNKQFRVAGGITGLFPGFSGTLTLSIYNPNNFQITVTALSVSKASVTNNGTDVSANCPGSTLLLNGSTNATVALPAGFTVGANSYAAPARTVSVSMDPAATDACQNAAYGLSYGGTATK